MHLVGIQKKCINIIKKMVKKEDNWNDAPGLKDFLKKIIAKYCQKNIDNF